MKHTKDLLREFGLSESEITLYLAMLSHGALRASELVKLTGGKRPTVYYALRQLVARGLVRTVAGSGAQRFQAEAPEHLSTLLELKRTKIDELLADAKTVISELKGILPSFSGLPNVSFYEGEEAMKQAVMETLYCRGKHIDSIAPRDNYFWQVGQAFSQRYIDERVRRKITTRNLWEEPLLPEIMTRSYKGISHVRILPKEMQDAFKTTVFIYDDKVMYISSKQSGYVLVVQSQEHHSLMKATYEALWSASAHISVR